MTSTATIVADSVNPAGVRLTTMICTYPRFIHSELMTHRVFSRNAASSRAVPIAKMIAAVEDKPAKPLRWGRNGKGMQDHGELTKSEAVHADVAWRDAAISATMNARSLEDCGLHKQIVNRVLEPFAWMTTIVSATDWANFFRLRVHPAAQPEFQHLAVLMLKAYIASTPKPLAWGEWHAPLADDYLDTHDRLRQSVARCARVSYTNHGKASTPEEDAALHDRLRDGNPIHGSPFEHQAMANCFFAVSSNFHPSWRQYRSVIEAEQARQPFDPVEHLAWYEGQSVRGKDSCESR